MTEVFSLKHAIALRLTNYVENDCMDIIQNMAYPEKHSTMDIEDIKRRMRYVCKLATIYSKLTGEVPAHDNDTFETYAYYMSIAMGAYKIDYDDVEYVMPSPSPEKQKGPRPPSGPSP